MSEGSRHESEGGVLDVAKGEAVERELDAMIERRSKHKEPEEESELWKESVRRYNARRQEELRSEWCDYHQGQAARHRATLEVLAGYHESEAARLMKNEEKESA